ncbi:MAG TPA: LuxR C-terminal-related transcriptional regulator [Polyangiaceae bacterium]|jgi:hypothetical protein
MVQAVAARARMLETGGDPLGLAARSRVQTRSGRWLLLYGTQLSGGKGSRVAVIVQPAAPHEVAPLVALAYGLSERECQITQLCMKGLSTKEIAQALSISTVHRAGPPEVDLRQDGRAQPRGTGRPSLP